MGLTYSNPKKPFSFYNRCDVAQSIQVDTNRNFYLKDMNNKTNLSCGKDELCGVFTLDTNVNNFSGTYVNNHKSVGGQCLFSGADASNSSNVLFLDPINYSVNVMDPSKTTHTFGDGSKYP